MRTDEQFSNFEGVCMFTIAFMSHIFSEMLPSLLHDLGPSAWIAQIASSLLAVAYLGLFWLLFRRYKGMDFLQICDAVYGKKISKAVQTLLFFYLLVFAGTTLNQCVEVVQVFSYADLSALKIDLLIMTAVVVLGFHSLKGLAKMISVFLPIIYIIILLILVFSYEQYDIDLLNPILGHGVERIGRYSVMLTTRFNPILLLSVAAGSFTTQKRYATNVLWGILISSVLVIGATICYCMAIPYSLGEEITTGIASLAQNNSTNRFFQRLESGYVAVNVTAIMLLVGYAFLLIKKTYCNIFDIQAERSRSVLVPLAVLVMCVARTINNLPLLKQSVRDVVRQYSVFFHLVLIVLTLVISLIRHQKKRRWAQTASILLIPCLLAGLLSGCGPYKEPDAEIFPIVVGYDKGEKEKYRITMKFMTESKTPQGQDTGETQQPAAGDVPNDVMVVEANSLSEGIQLMNSLLPREISLLHIKLIIISEELAREGVGEVLEPTLQDNEIKMTMLFSICKGNAYDLLASKNATLTAPVQSDIELLIETGRLTTSFVPITLSQFIFDYRSTYGDAMAIYSNLNQADYIKPEGSEEEDLQKQSPIEKIERSPADTEKGYLAGEVPAIGNRMVELAGMAVFRGDKMVGTLTTRECELLSFLTDTIDNTQLIFPDPLAEERYVTLKVRRAQPVKICTQIDAEGRANIDINVVVNALVSSTQNQQADYVYNGEHREILRTAISQEMSARGNAMIKKLQTEYQSDVLQLGRNVARHFRTIEEWETYHWAERYPQADIQVNFQFFL